jgi:hypothetical protein
MGPSSICLLRPKARVCVALIPGAIALDLSQLSNRFPVDHDMFGTVQLIYSRWFLEYSILKFVSILLNHRSS